jgi:hypothetical protein
MLSLDLLPHLDRPKTMSVMGYTAGMDMVRQGRHCVCSYPGGQRSHRAPEGLLSYALKRLLASSGTQTSRPLSVF